MSSQPTARQREAIVKRARGQCEYCRSLIKYAVQSFECEHIIPRSRGGKTALDNMALSCGGCNRAKAAHTTGLDPATGTQVALFHPRQQRWVEHFSWNEDFTLIVGLTATGRATVNRLRLNRPGVVNLRRVLLPIKEHPPADE